MKNKEKYIYYHNGKKLFEVVIKDQNDSILNKLGDKEKLKLLQSKLDKLNNEEGNKWISITQTEHIKLTL